jgi:RecA-family ATPase
MAYDAFDDAAGGLSDEELLPKPLTPNVVRYSRIKRQRVDWLWPGRLPAGKLVLLDGDPDVGKSTVTVELAARLTTGSPMPDGYLPPHPANVLFLRAEDGAADTVLPRLLAAGGDPDRFMELVSVPEIDDRGQPSYRPPELPTDVMSIDDVIRKEAISLVLIDPLVAFLADWVNAHRDQQVRRALTPIAGLAERTGATVLAIRHLNKTVGAPSLYRGGGSIGILAAARLVLVAGHDPDNEGRRLLAVYKSNLAPKSETLAYRIVPNELYDCGAVMWQGSSTKTGADILHLSDIDEEERASTDEAVAVLFEILGSGSVNAKDAMSQARQAGIGERALDRAKRVSGVVIERRRGTGSKVPVWVWRLPDPETLFEDGGDYGEGIDPHGNEPDG